ncbi:MAG TPA: TonB-dependent receptor [Candidatus Acidoferrum sp.]|nr:TonB-dependent receptor [Candidatus Acidoferrum sp.]
MSTALRIISLFAFLALCVLAGIPTFGQSETATLSGVIQDPKGGVVPDVEVTATRIETGAVATTRTNGAGIYFFTGLMPGHYHLTVRKPGFKEIAIKDFELHVQDKLEQNFSLEIGSASEIVTVTGDALGINTTDATVKTVVDRQFVKELPLNGRSFQTLFQLTPGTVIATTSYAEQGQFSVNGQRTNANYFQVDGVSANVGAAAGNSPGQSVGGSLPALTAAGGTNGVVSVDALQEFAIQTSTYAPEFGRTPGAQVAITTRSGTNDFHGDVFEYLRNDVVDANDWFANQFGLKRPPLRQNDFGGVFGGPILKAKTFFFVSYEGLRLRQPKTTLSDVPDLASRQAASATIAPFLNAFPLPTGPAEGNGLAPANYSYSDPSQLDAGSIRLDHRFNQELTGFVRYNFSSSYFKQRSGGAEALSNIEVVPVRLHTGTAGMTWTIAPYLFNDLRFNWSRSSASSSIVNDNFGGAVPLSLSSVLPSGLDPSTSVFGYGFESGNLTILDTGRNASNLQRQVNVVDNLSWQVKSHVLKFGVDYRRLTPQENSANYSQFTIFGTVNDMLNASPLEAILASYDGPVSITYDNYSIFAQDTWRASHALTVTYGLRWDYNPAPSGSGASGLQPLKVVGLDDLATVSVVSANPVYNATRDNFAPRLGLAYNLERLTRFPAVVRTGFGVFYDMGTGPTGDLFNQAPFKPIEFVFPSTFPLTPADAARPQPSTAPPYNEIVAFPNTLRQPYSYQWNLAYEQSLGTNQKVTASYVGSAGHSLIRTDLIQGATLNPDFGQIFFINNLGYSHYNAFQLQFARRQSAGLEILASYTYAHSLDNVSQESAQNPPSIQVRPALDYGDSDFDIRHTGSVAVDYEPPFRRGPAWMRKVLGGWGINTLVIARSATPVNVTVFQNTGFGFNSYRPDVVSGFPFYLDDPAAAGGRRINPKAFAVPIAVQGDLGRNSLRGYPLFQQDLSLRRNFHLAENVRLQARFEAFNVLNHPNFAPPNSSLGFVSNGTLIPSSSFGQSQAMFGTGVSSGGLGSGFNPLYQVGGPRSLQLALKVEF